MTSENPNQRIVEYWETQRLPQMHKTSPEFRNRLDLSYNEGVLTQLFQEPFLSPEEIERKQFERIRQLLFLAYEIPVYREKYEQVGFHPKDFKSWDDYYKLPVITKDELITAFPDYCLNPNYQITDLFPTRSSGSSGKTLRIIINTLLLDNFGCRWGAIH